MERNSQLKTTPQSVPESVMERVQLTPNLTVMTEGQEGQYRIYRSLLFNEMWLSQTSLLERSTPLMTQALLDGTYMAAYNEVHKGQLAPPVPKTTFTQNVWNLLNFYHPMLSTPKAQKIAAARFEEMGRDDLASHAYQELEEETGHHTLALEDLTALGLPAFDLVTKIKPPSVQVAALNLRYAQKNPIGLFGYNYALERIASLIGQEFIDVVKAANPPNVYATRTIEVHSSVGSDARHVQEMTEFVCELPAADREAILHAVFETATIVLSLPGRVKTDEEIHEILAEHGFNLEMMRQPAAAIN
ncbi:MAG: iron-containing redox enzyme family protein [Candidatus Obscuribacterales bacterium]|nr:iron-containing redox enzyme family protein [Candidatus Obscuribacterales bacterium]